MKQKQIKTSKFLSLILRHAPRKIGLQLDAQGWADIDELITVANKHGRKLDHALILDVVKHNDKQRFALSDDGKRIRANQGHSIKVNLGLDPATPPRVLFHGTATRFIESILRKGLRPSGRQHVHLSVDYQTAVTVGSRHGAPVILEIDSKQMDADGCLFYLSENGVWLTDGVAPQYLNRLPPPQP